MKTKILTLFLALAALMPAAKAQLTYTTNNGTINITGYKGGSFSGLTSITIPDNINGYPVTSIGDTAFNLFIDLTNAIIPSSVTSIGKSAFAYSALTSMQLPNSVTNIGSSAFKACNSLASIAIPDSVVTIGAAAFSYCAKLASLTISTNITSIVSGTFEACLSLTNVTIPSKVTSIGDEAFENCIALKSIIIPGTVTSLGEEAFGECENLTQVTLNNGLNRIGNWAFSDCGLTNVIIPASVTFIDGAVFDSCVNLTNITVATDNPFYSSLNGVLFDKDQTTLIQFPGNCVGKYVIPSSVTSIGDDAFGGADGLTDIFIGSGITSIDAVGFSTCSSLTNLTVATDNPVYSSTDSVLFNKSQTILIEFPGGYTGNYIVPDSVTNIGDYAFDECVRVTGVFIPSTVVSMGFRAFSFCTSLTNITFLGDAPPANSAFIGDSATVYYYPGTSGWSTTYGGLPTAELSALSNPPQIGGRGGNVGLQSDGNFGFTIAGTSSQTVTIEASTNLVNWEAIWTNTLLAASTNFTDPQWKNYPNRFYRAR